LADLGHPSKFQRVSCLGFVTAPTSLNGGQPNFAQCLAGTLYIHFRRLLPLTEFREVQNSLCVQVLHSPTVYWQRYCAALHYRSRCRLGCGLAWAQSIMCYMPRSDPPRERAILVDGRAHCKVQALSAVSCAKTAEPIHLPFRLWTRVGRMMHKFNRIRQLAPMCPHGRTRCRHLSNNTESSVYGGDAPYGKLL